MIGIYKITNPKNKMYIGQSVNIEKRFKEYNSLNSKTKRQTKLWRSFLKYGVENHCFEIKEEVLVSELTDREGYWQDYYDAIHNGLNCRRVTTKDRTGYLSFETIEKTRLKNLGRKDSPEILLKKRERMIGNTYNTNRKRKDWEKVKISNTMKELKINCKENNPMWGRFGENNPTSKLIIDTDTGIFYFGVKEAAKAKNISYSTLKKAICGNRVNKTSLIYC